MNKQDLTQAATSDLLVIADILVDGSGNPHIATRFLSAAASTFEVIRAYPSAGRMRPPRQGRLVALRSLRLDAPFGKYLLFYQAELAGTLILRVLHGAQDFGFAADVDAERDV